MLFNTVALLSASALAAPVILKRDEDRDDSLSGPFKIRVVSGNSTINGGTITPVHAGAAIEALQVGGAGTNPSNWSNYYFNQSSFGGDDNEYGALVWDLNIANNQTVPSSLKIPYTSSRSLVPVWFSPGAEADDTSKYLALSFDDDGYLGAADSKVQRFYACQQNVGGYNYYSVAWSTDRRDPENKSCSRIRLQRVELDELEDDSNDDRDNDTNDDRDNDTNDDQDNDTNDDQDNDSNDDQDNDSNDDQDNDTNDDQDNDSNDDQDNDSNDDQDNDSNDDQDNDSNDD